MDKIGFGDLPYLAYYHNDATHPDLYILTTNIQEIQFTTLPRKKLEIAGKAIEEKYGLVKAPAAEMHHLDHNLNADV